MAQADYVAFLVAIATAISDGTFISLFFCNGGNSVRVFFPSKY